MPNALNKALAFTDNREKKHSNLIPFRPGQSGNPKGRPKGSRNKLSEEFIAALYESFVEEGQEAIRRVAREHPIEYLRIIVAVLPKDVRVGRSQSEKLEGSPQAVREFLDQFRQREDGDEDPEGQENCC